jgi:hypothetical protein
LTMMRYRPGSDAVGVRPSDRARSAPGRLRRAIRWARTMSGSRASAVSGSCRPLVDPRWRLAFCICFMCGLQIADLPLALMSSALGRSVSRR